MIRKIFLVIYYLIASKLPNYVFPGGKAFNWLRVYALKRIIKIGPNCRIMRSVYIGNGIDIEIGSNSRINENVRLDNVIIGSNVMIARDTIILGKMHGYDNTSIPMNIQKVKECNKTLIEDDVWIGTRAIIMPGITVKRGSIIGAGAVVTRNTEEYGIYGGVPSRLIKYRI